MLCEEHNADTKRLPDGRFVVKLPFSADPNVLGNNKEQAVKRLTFLEPKLAKDPELKESYTEFLNEYFENDEMERRQKTSTSLLLTTSSHSKRF